MKKKIAIFIVATTLGIYSAYACSVSECGGGTTVCCTVSSGKSFTVYYTKG